MRVVTIMAAVAALWAVPAQAVDIVSGVFTGTITSGTADLQDGSLQTIQLADLTGLTINFAITTDLNPNGRINTSFSIPNAPNQLMKGYPLNPGFALSPDLVMQSGNKINIKGGAFAGTNNSISFDLTGPLSYTPAQATEVYSLLGTISGTQWGLGSDYGRVRYNFTVDLTGWAWARGAAAPEPSTWALMIVGIGFAGAAMRRRQTVSLKHALGVVF